MHLSVLSAVTNGSNVAIAFSMRNKAAIHRQTGITSFWQGVRAFAEASLIALAFGFAILLIGVPLALSVRVVYERLSWLARLGGEMGPVVQTLVSVASVVGGIIATAVFTSGLVGFFRWRRALRGENRTHAIVTDSSFPRQPRTAES